MGRFLQGRERERARRPCRPPRPLREWAANVTGRLGGRFSLSEWDKRLDRGLTLNRSQRGCTAPVKLPTCHCPRGGVAAGGVPPLHTRIESRSIRTHLPVSPVLSQLLGAGRGARRLLTSRRRRSWGDPQEGPGARPKVAAAQPARGEGDASSSRGACPAPLSHPSPTDPALRANPYPGYGSDLPTSLTYIVLTCQRLFTLETCCGYGYGPARDLHHLPRIFKGQRELTGRRRNRDAFQGSGPSLGANPFQGALPFTKKRELSPGLPPASPGSVASPHWTPRGARLRRSGFGDLNPTPFRSAGGDGGHRPSLPNGVRPSLRTD
ncbi:hypothetical protein GJAV_G00276080 [Gymnothorax javanicus]|nr:hypothetical protein GJAV_G00276080 [Gymnothorax javanicus]